MDWLLEAIRLFSTEETLSKANDTETLGTKANDKVWPFSTLDYLLWKSFTQGYPITALQ